MVCALALCKFSSAPVTLSPIFSDFIKISIELGAYPSKLNISKIAPVFKSDDECDASNYRPISLLSKFNRIFEKVMYNRMKDFIGKHDMSNPSQYGFHKAHGTHHGIVDSVEAIYTNMDQGLFTCGIFVDLK